MDKELFRKCIDLDDARHDTMSRVNIRRRKLWAAAYALCKTDVPRMTDEDVEVFTELAYLSIIPAYRHITLMTYSTALQHVPHDYKEYFAHLVMFVRRLDTHGDHDLATDEDWLAWMESM
jgi:hypothetical protein